jgi:hypothetical protein
VRAIDPASNATSPTASATVTVLAALPGAAFTLSPGAPTQGQAVVFDGSGSSDAHGGGIVAWQWSFGDGALDIGAIQHHTYDNAGTFNVSLTVTNALGQSATTTQAVKVMPDAAAVRRFCRSLLDQEVHFALTGFKANAALSWLTSTAQPPGSTAASKDAVLAYSVSRVKGGEILATVTGAGADPARELKALKACAARCCGLPSQGCTGASRRLLATALQGLLKVAAKRRHGFVVTSTRRPLPASCQAPSLGVGQRLSVFVLTQRHRTELIQIQLS